MRIRDELNEIPSSETSSIPSPATSIVKVSPGRRGKGAVDNSLFIPISCGVNAGAAEKTEKSNFRFELELTLSDCDGVELLATKLRNAGVVSVKPAVLPLAPMSLAVTGP